MTEGGRGRTRVLRIAILAAVVVVVLAYGVASAIVWDRLTKVSGDCPASEAANSSGGFVVPNGKSFDEAPYLMPAPEAVSFRAGIRRSPSAGGSSLPTTQPPRR